MNRKSAWIVLAVVLLITLPTRLYQVLFLTDKKTGFFTDGNVTTAVISAGLAAGVLLIVAMSIMDRRAPKGYQPIHSTPAGVIGALAGLSLAVESVISLFGGGSTQNHFMYMILSLFGILAGATLILTAYDFAVGENHFTRYPILALVPPVWGCVCLVTLFITYVAVVNVSENIYNTFTVIFLLLFLFAQAKMLAGVENEKSSSLIYVFGLPAILLSLVTGIPGVVSLFSGMIQTGYFPVGLHFVNILTALYIAAFLFEVSRLPEAAAPNQPELAELQKSDLPIHETDAEESGTGPLELNDRKNCLEFLAMAYHSEERFVERVPSPFYESNH